MGRPHVEMGPDVGRAARRRRDPGQKEEGQARGGRQGGRVPPPRRCPPRGGPGLGPTLDLAVELQPLWHPWDYGRRGRGEGDDGEPARPGGCWQLREGVGKGESQLGRRGLNGRGSRDPGRRVGLPLWGEAGGPLARLVPPAPAWRPLQPILPQQGCSGPWQVLSRGRGWGGQEQRTAGCFRAERGGRGPSCSMRVPALRTQWSLRVRAQTPPSGPSPQTPPTPAPLGSPKKPDGKPQRRGGGGGGHHFSLPAPPHKGPQGTRPASAGSPPPAPKMPGSLGTGVRRYSLTSTFAPAGPQGGRGVAGTEGPATRPRPPPLHRKPRGHSCAVLRHRGSRRSPVGGQ